jgi:hypothetical protein
MNPLARMVACASIAASMGCAGHGEAPSTPAPSKALVYENPQVGLRVTLPVGWQFVSSVQVESDARAAFEALPDRSDDERFSAAHTHVLFSMVDATEVAAGWATPSVTCTVEEFDAKFRALDSMGYARSTARGVATIEVVGPPHEVPLAGRTFVRVPCMETYQGQRGHRDYHVNAEAGRGLMCVVIYPEHGTIPQAALDAIQPAR